VAAGDAVVGLASSGAHSNGYSLIRKLIQDSGAGPDTTVGGARLFDLLMEPTRIYVKPLLALAAALELRALAHITGGGLTGNIPRVLPAGLGVRLQRRAWQRGPLWDWIQRAGAIEDAEMHRTFNCGIGMVAVVAAGAAQEAVRLLGAAGEQAAVIGEVVATPGVQID
jgi:phosphoribosylformylglycinamidine cyclo-ligase